MFLASLSRFGVRNSRAFSTTEPVSTSLFDEAYRIKLGITFRRVNDPKRIVKCLPTLSDDVLMLGNEIILAQSSPPNNMVPVARTIYRDASLIRSTEEAPKVLYKHQTDEKDTNLFANDLLHAAELNLYPLMLRLQPEYEFSTNHTTITSIPDFGVEGRDLSVIIVEDKRIGPSRYTGWGENQIAGEMVAAAGSRMEDRDSCTVIAIRIIGTKFSFFRVDVGEKYFESLGKGFPISEKLSIDVFLKEREGRDPPGFDYCIPDERSVVVSMLRGLRSYMLSEG